MFGAERLQALLAAEHDQGRDTVLERVETTVAPSAAAPSRSTTRR